jgi:Predicted membrane protein
MESFDQNQRIQNKMYPFSVYEDSIWNTFINNFAIKYLEWSGRLSLVDYIKTSVVLTIIFSITSVGLFLIIPSANLSKILIIFVTLFIGISVVPSISLLCRRLNDIGLNKTKLLYLLFPVFGVLYLFFTLLRKSEESIRYIERGKKSFWGSSWTDSTYKIIYFLSFLLLLGVCNIVYKPLINSTLLVSKVETIASNIADEYTKYTTIDYINRNKEDKSLKSKAEQERAEREQIEKQKIEQNQERIRLESIEKAKQKNIDQAQNAIEKFYLSIDQQKYNDAFNMFSDNQRNVIGNFGDWKQGYQNTMSVELKRLDLKNYSDTAISFEYLLYSNDRIPSGVEQKIFRGNIIMLKINGSWYIDSQDGELLRSERLRDSYNSYKGPSYNDRR